MNWSDERYVRLYTRDTPDWLFWSWQARALFPLLLRKVDRAGVIDLGQRGAKSVAILVGLPVEVVELGLAELLGDGCVAVTDNVLVIRNFIEAQETPQSDKARQRESRARRHADAERGVTKRDQTSQNVTENHESSRGVTDGHAASRDVTLAVPCRAVPYRAVPEKILAPVGASSVAKEPAPDARAPATDPAAPPPLTLDGAPPRRAARAARKRPPPDPAERADADAFLAAHRRLFGSPEAAWDSGRFLAYRALRRKHGSAQLLAWQEVVAADEWVRTHCDLAWCLSAKMPERGAKILAGGARTAADWRLNPTTRDPVTGIAPVGIQEI